MGTDKKGALLPNRHASEGWHLGRGSERGRTRPPETPACAGVTKRGWVRGR